MHFDSKHLIAAVSYIFFFVPYFTSEKRDSFVAFHAKQGLGFFLFAAALRGIITALGGPPNTAIGSILSSLLLQPAHLVLIILIVYGIWNALNDRMQPLPVIGKYFEKW